MEATAVVDADKKDARLAMSGAETILNTRIRYLVLGRQFAPRS